MGLLDSAAVRPRSTAFGEDAHPTLALEAAALLHSLTRNHTLVDGSRRPGWSATVVFLDLDAHEPDLGDDAAFQLVMDVAAGAAEVEEIADRLGVVPRRTP